MDADEKNKAVRETLERVGRGQRRLAYDQVSLPDWVLKLVQALAQGFIMFNLGWQWGRLLLLQEQRRRDQRRQLTSKRSSEHD